MQRHSCTCLLFEREGSTPLLPTGGNLPVDSRNKPQILQWMYFSPLMAFFHKASKE